MDSKESDQADKVYLVCLNPHCLNDRERCLITKTLHQHPQECAPYYYPADEIMQTPWSELEKYPADNLGIASKRKFEKSKGQSYIVCAIRALREKIEASLKELEIKMLDLYPEK